MISWTDQGLKLVSLSLMILLLVSVSVWSANDKSLVLYYPLDGDTKDASQNANDGEIQGKSKWVDGKFGAKAIDLDPNAWINLFASQLPQHTFSNQPLLPFEPLNNIAKTPCKRLF